MTHKPTGEQIDIICAYGEGTDLTVEAGAGTGKTSTLKMLAATTPGKSGVYLAYNKAIADEAGRSFPSSVTCKTAHAFAYAAVGRNYRGRLKAPRVPAKETARILRINEPVRVAEGLAPLAPQQLARIVMSTVDRFCHSADDEVTYRHVPFLQGLDKAGQRALSTAIVPWATAAWDDINSHHGSLRFTHDCYLKMWQLSRPQLGADYVLLDEAQDANPAVADIVERQKSQRILVGDRCQAIYGWRGAVDAMADFSGKRLYLSQSFRFGPAVAAEANKWLSVLGATLRLTGYDRITSKVEPIASPAAILCRTNAGAFNRVIESLEAGRRTALVGGSNDIKRMAEAAAKLQMGQPCDHPELLAFSRWSEVQDYVENDQAGSDLKVFVQLVDKLGTAEILSVCHRLVPEDRAQTIVSTAHKAKGREWDTVRIATDFREPVPDPETGERPDIAREDAMLAYVAVTRAQLGLDRAGLAWVDGWITPAGPPAIPAQPAAHVHPAVDEHRCFLCDPSERDRWPAPLAHGGVA